MRKRRLKRTCGQCKNCKKKYGFREFLCKIFGYKIFERSSAVGCKNYHKFKKTKYPID